MQNDLVLSHETIFRTADAIWSIGGVFVFIYFLKNLHVEAHSARRQFAFAQILTIHFFLQLGYSTGWYFYLLLVMSLALASAMVYRTLIGPPNESVGSGPSIT